MSDNFNFPVKCGYERITPGDFVFIESSDLSCMYARNYSVTIISPLIDTSKSRNFTDMFYDCSSLKYVSGIDTTNAQTTTNMFYGCGSIRKIPLMDLSNVTDMSCMFYNCGIIEEIPFMNTSNVQNMNYAFSGCYQITSLPPLNTSNLINASELLGYCANLRYIPLLDFGNVMDMGGFFSYGEINKLTDVDGFKDLGKQQDMWGMDYGFLNQAPNLTHESLMNVINNLYDRRSAGYHELNIEFGYRNLEKLTDEEKTIAINKGWVLI